MSVLPHPEKYLVRCSPCIQRVMFVRRTRNICLRGTQYPCMPRVPSVQASQSAVLQGTGCLGTRLVLSRVDTGLLHRAYMRRQRMSAPTQNIFLRCTRFRCMTLGLIDLGAARQCIRCIPLGQSGTGIALRHRACMQRRPMCALRARRIFLVRKPRLCTMFAQFRPDAGPPDSPYTPPGQTWPDSGRPDRRTSARTPPNERSPRSLCARPLALM